jgi:hypothetical protein
MRAVRDRLHDRDGHVTAGTRVADAFVMRTGMLAAAMLAVGGCALDETAADAREVFVTRAWPALASCVGCHNNQPGLEFLAPGTPDAYDTLFAHQPPVLDLESPPSSLLVSMGKHTGPALTPERTAAVLEWLDAERAARVAPEPPAITLGPATVVLGVVNTIDLAPAGVPGAVLRFVPGVLGESGMTLENIELSTGATAVHIAHPLFVSHPAQRDPIPDPLDRFSYLDEVVEPSTTLELGAAVFLGFAPTDPLAIHVRTLEVTSP